MVSEEELLSEASIQDNVVTRFPNLHSDTVESFHIKSFQRSSLELPVDDEATIILSWAFLLNCYTRDNELRFMVDDSLVTVQVETWVIQRSQYMGDVSVLYDGTGILTRVLREEANVENTNAYV